VEFSELEAVYKRWLSLEHDPDLIRTIYSILLANYYDGNPVWGMFIGPAGCGKSQILMSLSGSDLIVPVSNLTPQALASGYGDGSDSLLYELDEKILVVEDMSSVTEMPKEAKNLLFSFFRAAYNGEFIRVTGRNKISWRGKFGLLAGATLALESGRKMESMLGERFLYIRSRANGIDERTLMRMARKNISKKTIMAKELSNASGEFLSKFKAPNTVKLPDDIEELVDACAIALAKGRSGVVRDGYSKEVSFPVDRSELGTRLCGQFGLLAESSHALGGSWVDVKRVLYRIMHDSMPYPRLRILKAIAFGNVRLREITKSVQMSGSYVQRTLEDMVSTKSIEKNRKKEYEIVDKVMLESVTRNLRN